MISKFTEKTFHFKDLEIDINSNVYDPAEDTFLLLESIQNVKGKIVLEIGTGCGLIALELSRRGADVICSDINPYAIELSEHNIDKNKHLLSGKIEVRKGNLFSVVKKGELFDIIIFNPPYLPTDEEQKIDEWFDKAVDGGKDGLTITKRFIKGLSNHFSKDGCAYFVFSSLANRTQLENYILEERLQYDIVLSKTFNDESLDIYFLTK